MSRYAAQKQFWKAAKQGHERYNPADAVLLNQLQRAADLEKKQNINESIKMQVRKKDNRQILCRLQETECGNNQRRIPNGKIR